MLVGELVEELQARGVEHRAELHAASLRGQRSDLECRSAEQQAQLLQTRMSDLMVQRSQFPTLENLEEEENYRDEVQKRG